VVIRADGGALTSDAGVLLLRQLDERLGLTRRLAGRLVDGQDARKVRHELLAVLSNDPSARSRRTAVRRRQLET
jgi:hypothetical protein